MIKPFQSHDELLADIQNCKCADDRFYMWWLGQSGFLLKWRGGVLLFDPYLSDSLTKKYATTDKPHQRMTELVIDPRRLDFIDVVTSSHNHTDHLDGETLTALLEVNPKLAVVVPRANQQFAADRLQIDPTKLTSIEAGETIESHGFSIHGVPAAHETVERDETGRCKFLGYVVEFGPWTVYHSGDTILFDEMVDNLKSWAIDLALLPINGRKPERRVQGNLWGREAAQLAHDIGARSVTPCHFEMFEFNTVAPREFIESCENIGQSFHVLHCGERLCSAKL